MGIRSTTVYRNRVTDLFFSLISLIKNREPKSELDTLLDEKRKIIYIAEYPVDKIKKTADVTLNLRQIHDMSNDQINHLFKDTSLIFLQEECFSLEMKISSKDIQLEEGTIMVRAGLMDNHNPNFFKFFKEVYSLKNHRRNNNLTLKMMFKNKGLIHLKEAKHES